MNKFKPNKKQKCVLCKKLTGDRPLYGVTTERVVCETCWQDKPAACEAVLAGKLAEVEPLPAADVSPVVTAKPKPRTQK